MRILVCGGRDYANPIPYDHSQENRKALDEYRFVHSTLQDLVSELSRNYNPHDNWLPTDITIINGGASGVDSAASDFAIVNYCQLEEYPADWERHGRAAGPIRNQKMINEGRPDLVISFSGGKGTEDMIKRAEKAGIPVRRIG